MSAIDEGLLSPVTVGYDELVRDEKLLDALVLAECSLVAAYAAIGVAPAEAERAVARTFDLDDPRIRPGASIDTAKLAAAAVAGGNPVIPLVGLLKAQLPEEHRVWIHRGATSQDIWDTAIQMVARRAVQHIRRLLENAAEWLLQHAETHRDDVAAARTLTQHAVPTTIGLRAANWARGIGRAADRLGALEFPAQLGGAGGTLASFVEITGSTDAAQQLVAAYARRTGLDAPAAPWHVIRWPITELGDALVQAIDALGKVAADIATLSRTEIGEVAEHTGGGSSAMPQKQNPAESVLIRSAALRAPQLGATLHIAAAAAVDERPDGAWHAEWPTLRELLRLALGAVGHASSLTAHLRIDVAAAAANVGSTGGLIMSERLSVALAPLLGKDAVAAIVADVGDGADLSERVREAATAAGVEVDVDALLDPAGYTGLAGPLVDTAVRDIRFRKEPT